jgi:hypothetical protein
VPPPADYGWERRLNPGRPGVFAPRVEWVRPQGVPDSFSVYANRNGVGLCGVFFGHKGHAATVAALLALAAAVAAQLARGAALDRLDFAAPDRKESAP